MGGEIHYNEKEQLRQENSNLKHERDELRRALEDICRAKGQKSRHDLIEKAKKILWPAPKEKVNWFESVKNTFWAARLP